MESVREILSGLDLAAILRKRGEIKKPENCMGCGAVLEWKHPSMYQQRCRCGLLIVVQGRMPERKTECWACFDSGMCSYEVQFDGLIYTLTSACTCRSGDQWVGPSVPRFTEAKYAPPSIQEIVKRNIGIAKKEG